MTTNIQAGHPASEIDSSYAWMRLAVVLLLGTIGSVGMWSFVVALPAVQSDFGIARGEASLPFTLTMAGFGIGGVVMGRLADRFGIVMPVMVGAVALGAGYGLSGVAGRFSALDRPNCGSCWASGRSRWHRACSVLAVPRRSAR